MKNLVLLLLTALFLHGCSKGISKVDKEKIAIDGKYKIVDIIVANPSAIQFYKSGYSIDNIYENCISTLDRKAKSECLGNIVNLKKHGETIMLSAQYPIGDLTSDITSIPFAYNTDYSGIGWSKDEKGKLYSKDYYSVYDFIGSSETRFLGTSFLNTYAKTYGLSISYYRNFWQRLKAPETIPILGVVKTEEEAYSFVMTLKKIEP